MTVQPETRFRCDRCDLEEILPMQNTPAPRPKAPEHWITFWVDSTDRQQHFCPKCAVDFGVFMMSPAPAA